MKRKILTTVLALICLAGILAGCGTKGGPPASEETLAAVMEESLNVMDMQIQLFNMMMEDKIDSFWDRVKLQYYYPGKNSKLSSGWEDPGYTEEEAGEDLRQLQQLLEEMQSMEKKYQ